MMKRVILFLVASVLFLTACAPKTPTQAPAAEVKQQPSGPAMEGCSVVDLLPTPDPELAKLIPEVQKDDHVLGSASATVTFIEYSDFQCPYCSVLSPVIPQLVARYPDDVRVIFRHYPLNMHPNALLASHASEAAALQGKFYDMEKVIFANQEAWAGGDEATARAWMIDQAKTLGLDVAKFERDLDSDAVKARVDRNLQEATKAQLPGTPFLFINGLPYQQAMDLETLSGLVEVFKMQANKYTACPPMVIDPAKQYQAKVDTDQGSFTINLYADKAPITVNSFVFLAREGYFNNVGFHRVLPGFVAQGGDPSGSGFGGPGYQFKNENAEALFDRKGLVAMANSGADTNGSQFFITYAEQPDLNGGYTIFGEVTEGMDVVEKLTPRDPATGADLPQPDRIRSITIIEK